LREVCLSNDPTDEQDMAARSRYLRKWAKALGEYEEASARYHAVTGEYLGMVGTVRHGGHHLLTEPEAKIMAKRDHRRQKAIDDQQFFGAEATMYGIAVLVELMTADE
jgi:hypothetical protein